MHKILNSCALRCRQVVHTITIRAPVGANKLTSSVVAIAISNLKLSITHPLFH